MKIFKLFVLVSLNVVQCPEHDLALFEKCLFGVSVDLLVYECVTQILCSLYLKDQHKNCNVNPHSAWTGIRRYRLDLYLYPRNSWCGNAVILIISVIAISKELMYGNS